MSRRKPVALVQPRIGEATAVQPSLPLPLPPRPDHAAADRERLALYGRAVDHFLTDPNDYGGLSLDLPPESWAPIERILEEDADDDPT